MIFNIIERNQCRVSSFHIPSNVLAKQNRQTAFINRRRGGKFGVSVSVPDSNGITIGYYLLIVETDGHSLAKRHVLVAVVKAMLPNMAATTIP